MSFAEYILGRKNPTAAEIGERINDTKAGMIAAERRIAEAKGAFERIAYMSDAEHAAAEAELPAAERSRLRLEKRLDELANDLVVAQKREADAALAARRKAVQRRVDSEYSKLLDRLDAKMAEVAELAVAMQSIQGEASALNSELQKARMDSGRTLPDDVVTPSELYFTEPEIVTPATTYTEKKWMYLGEDDRWHEVCVFVERDGETVPQMIGAKLRSFERTIPENRTPGRRMMPPTASLCLPATRLDGQPHWPRRA